MKPDRMSRELERSQDRLARLRSRVDEEGAGPALAEAVEELGQALEELRVSLEELDVQSEELARARLAAEETARHYADLFRAAPDLYLVTDARGVIVEANEVAAARLGHKLEYLPGKPLGVFLAASARADFERLLSATLADRAAHNQLVELRFEPQSAPHFWGALRAAVIRDAGGAVEGVRWLIRDVSDRRRSEEALRQALARNQAILDTAAEAVVVIDSSGTIETFNASAVRMFGYAAEEVIGHNVRLLMPPPHRARHDEYIARYLRTGESRIAGRPRELIARRKGGTTFPVELSVTRVDELDRFTGIIRDLSEQRRLQGQLRAMTAEAAVAEERERRSLAQDLHDDLGQLLSLASLKIAQLRDAHGTGVSGALGEIEKLVRDAHERTGSITFRLSPPLLHDVGLAAAAEWLADEMERRYGLRVTVRDDGRPKAVDEASRTILFRALRELLINVARHARTSSADVRLWSTDGTTCLSVEDRGVGFDASEGPEAGGFGLLSIRERLHHLGGSMAVESVPGDGTRIALVVPDQTRARAAGSESP